jgi:signal transduction histidine kinase
MAGLKVVLHGSYGGMDAAVADKLQDLHTHLNRMLGMTNDFLGKACCLQGALLTHHEELNLVDDVLAVVLDEISGETRAHRIFFDQLVEAQPRGAPLVANRLGMKIVFRNLIRNAVHHGAAGCAIVCGYQEHADHHRLNVYISGLPIARECRERLFTQFGTFRNRPESKHEGMGLGLYLTREIVRTHGGEIWYEAGPCGSNFIFTIPRVPAPSPNVGNGAGI